MQDTKRIVACLLGVPLIAACSQDTAAMPGGYDGGSQGSTEASDGAGEDGNDADASSESSDSTDTGPILDVGANESGTDGEDLCSVPEDGVSAPGDCVEEAPADSFAPVLQWSWKPPSGAGSVVTPLVANFTDDDQNGSIDMCDTPDVVVVTRDRGLHLLDGAGAGRHWKAAEMVAPEVTPAIGDIDGDGLVEIVTFHVASISPDGTSETWELAAWNGDGTLQWSKPIPVEMYTEFASLSPLTYKAVSLADLDADGQTEILVGTWIWDHEGNLNDVIDEINLSPTVNWEDEWDWNIASVAVDLDEDGDLEIIGSRAVYDHDGSMKFLLPFNDGAFPSVGDFDGDGRAEIVLTGRNGISMVEHDGTVIFTNQEPMPPSGFNPYNRPSTVHDFDGDGVAEFASSNGNIYAVYRPDLSILWQSAVDDLSGVASGTAFDFLGDGKAEAMYCDEEYFYAYGDDGSTVMQLPRYSGTIIEYPIVVDVDNDLSAEIIVTSDSDPFGDDYPTVQVFGDAEDRWIPARRIWNQHAYHVTNVYEDGRIPTEPILNWKSFNTFRSNSQTGENGDCIPPVD